MCGIVGAVSTRNIVPVLVEGLKRLEYRGYDSCGVAVYDALGPKRARSVSRVAELDAQVRETALTGFTGIAHTRWATHGAPATHNAHPHFSPSNESARIALVHNGIIENYEALRIELIAKGYVFVSQTDTEVIAHLIDSLYDGDLFDATRGGRQAAARRVCDRGVLQRGAASHRRRARRFAARARLRRRRARRHGSALKGECFLASDAMALAGVTDRIVYLEDGDVVDIQLGHCVDHRPRGPPRRRARCASSTRPAAAPNSARTATYMQKEIFEQPRAIADTLEGLVDVDGRDGAIGPWLFDAAGDGRRAAAAFAAIDSVLILACGTSYYSGLTAKYWLESIARIPTQVEIASEYRYRDSVPNPKALVVVISAVRRDGRHARRAEAREVARPRAHARDLQRRHDARSCGRPNSRT